MPCLQGYATGAYGSLRGTIIIHAKSRMIWGFVLEWIEYNLIFTPPCRHLLSFFWRAYSGPIPHLLRLETAHGFALWPSPQALHPRSEVFVGFRFDSKSVCTQEAVLLRSWCQTLPYTARRPCVPAMAKIPERFMPWKALHQKIFLFLCFFLFLILIWLAFWLLASPRHIFTEDIYFVHA